MHPFVKILCFILILLLMSVLSHQLLFLLFTLLCIVAVKLQFKHFLRTVRRMRWLFISILIIYAFGTPGELIPQFPVNIAPSFEGVQLGLLQIERLVIALAALSLLFTTSSKEQLMLGLYMLLKPFKYFGFNVEKFSVRLLLTLDYVEDFAAKDFGKLSFKQFDDIALSAEAVPSKSRVNFQKIPFNRVDRAMIVLVVMSFLVLFLWRLL